MAYLSEQHLEMNSWLYTHTQLTIDFVISVADSVPSVDMGDGSNVPIIVQLGGSHC